MTAVFLKLLNMSISASYLVLAVILLRLVLKSAPKWINCLLWSMVALRLLIPFAAESAFSLIPSAEVIPRDITTTQTSMIYSGIPAVNSAVNPLFTAYPAQTESVLDKLLPALSAVWLAGVAIMLCYGVVMYLKLHWQVRASIVYRKNIYACDDVHSPFILGVLFPKIYIPSGMDEDQLQYVLAHENAHIRRRDHWWKPLGFLLLTVYWFNPLLWVAYILLCRDIERACDEKVIAELDNAGKKGYSEALVACSAHRRMIMVCPVAFGEIGVKTRVKGILNYKKPAFWIVIVSVAACVITAVCFLTNPKPCAHTYQVEVVKAPTCTSLGVEKHTCSECQHMYTSNIAMGAHSFDQPVVTLAPTCTNKGSAQQTCADCGLVKTVELATVAHTAGEPFFVKEPNCTQQGARSATCTVCAAVFQVEILPVNGTHIMEETVLRAPTCTATGEGILHCTLCDHTEHCTLEKTPHDYQVAEITEATCRQEGKIQSVCTGCDDFRVQITSRRTLCLFEPAPGGKRCIYCGRFIPRTSVNWQDTVSNSVIDYAFWTFDMEKGQWRAQWD